ncbi:hypothetical protein MAR_035161, partial [Mya arenaria]
RTHGTESISHLVSSYLLVFDTWPAFTIIQARLTTSELIQTPSLIINEVCDAIKIGPSFLCSFRRDGNFHTALVLLMASMWRSHVLGILALCTDTTSALLHYPHDPRRRIHVVPDGSSNDASVDFPFPKIYVVPDGSSNDASVDFTFHKIYVGSDCSSNDASVDFTFPKIYVVPDGSSNDA